MQIFNLYSTMLMELKQDEVRNQAYRGEDYNIKVVQHSSERTQEIIQVSLHVAKTYKDTYTGIFTCTRKETFGGTNHYH